MHVDSDVLAGLSTLNPHLQVIYVPDEMPESVFVITAYELKGKARMAFRRRRRRRK